MKIWGWLGRRHQLPPISSVDPEVAERLDQQRRLWPEIRRLVHDLTNEAEKNQFSARIEQAFRTPRG